MNMKYIVSGALIAFGGLLALRGFLNGVTGYINLGIAAMVIGAVILVLKPSTYVRKEALETVLNSQKAVLDGMVDSLNLEGNAVFVPPYENLPRGGLFLPLHRDFTLDLARLDEEVVFLTDVPNEKGMGLCLLPPGANLVEKFEEHLEGPLGSVAEAESASSAVLRALGLASTVYIEEEEENYRVVVRPGVRCSPEGCSRVPCPVCSSVLLALAKATGQLIEVEGVEKKDYGIEIRGKKLGGVREWM
ncbi:hypothetical protein [Palaeococcus ferrophilus]|uniref:hypothetical protein n=1 Tax=Palaeococcus ferrophilus TaxID=83868 RepID=UPI00064FE92D|nr:hypothetical protein [Palaeococcus ferrophilus]